MKKIFIGHEGKFYGMAKKIEQSEENLTVTMPGDFPGMAERKVVFNHGTILYEDNNRVYIDYK